MKHVYLSPHLDDAVLSCGGAIHRHMVGGEAVLVVGIFAGEYQDDHLSPFALEQHRYWGQPPQPMALRRAEDKAALTFLTARWRHLDYLDAVYRLDPQGRWLYTDVDKLLGEIHPSDPLGRDGARGLAAWLAGLIRPSGQQAIYAPLGVGRHVDHQIVHAAARRMMDAGYRVAYYEDYPYAEKAESVDLALAAATAESWRPELITLDASDLAGKVAALGYYRSQLGILFGGAEAMPTRVWSFAATREPPGLAERIWWPE